MRKGWVQSGGLYIRETVRAGERYRQEGQSSVTGLLTGQKGLARGRVCPAGALEHLSRPASTSSATAPRSGRGTWTTARRHAPQCLVIEQRRSLHRRSAGQPSDSPRTSCRHRTSPSARTPSMSRIRRVCVGQDRDLPLPSCLVKVRRLFAGHLIMRTFRVARSCCRKAQKRILV